jgi:hypothetical protein
MTAPVILAEKGGWGGIVLDAAYVPPDDALILIETAYRGAGAIDVPAGFTRLDPGDTSTMAVGYKIALGEVGAAYGGGGGTNNHVYVFAPGTTIGQVVHRSAVGPTAAVDCGGSITPAQDDVLLVGVAVNGYFFSANPATPTGGETTRRNHADPTGNPPTIWVADKAIATPVASSVTGTWAVSETWWGLTVEILGAPDPIVPGMWFDFGRD